MDIPLIMPLPQAPSRADGPAAFNALADPFIAALPPFALQMNVAVQWLAAAMATVLDYKNAAATSAINAADSATLAGQQVGLAADQVALAVTARQAAEAALASSEVIAAAVQDAAGMPSLAGNAGKALSVKNDETGVEFKALGQAVGEVLETTRTPDATYILPDTIYSRSAYPDLFAIVGTQGEKNDGSNFAAMSTGFTGTVRGIAAGKDNVLIAVGTNAGSTAGVAIKSLDGGATWAAVATLDGGAKLNAITTDGNGVWVAGGYNGSVKRSIDNGLTWSDITATGIGAAVNGVLISTNRSGSWVVMLYASSDSAVCSVSTDNGATWTSKSGITTVGSCIYFGNTINFNSSGGATWFRSYDNMTSYSNAGKATALACSDKVMVAADTTSGLTYISTDNVSFKIAVGLAGNINVSGDTILVSANNSVYFKSTDFGETFVKQSQATASYLNIAAMDGNGNWITCTTAQSFAGMLKATRLYNYDVATQFKTPARKAPKGYKAYIKGKLQ